jgi:hypothetical protein
MLAQSRRGIRRTMILVSHRVGSFQISRNHPSRTPSKTRAAALFELKPAATNTFVSITMPSTCPPQVEFYCGNCRRNPLAELVDANDRVPGFTMAGWVASSSRVHRAHLRREPRVRISAPPLMGEL